MSLGTLSYGAPPHEIQMEERLLAHVKIVIIDKLRRNESFLLSWGAMSNEGLRLMPEPPEA